MKRFLILMGFIFLFISISAAHADLYFPHIDTNSPWGTEIAIINTSATQSVSGTLNAYSNTGQLIDTMGITLDPHGRRQITIADELTNPTTIGYLIFDTDAGTACGYTKFYVSGQYRVAVPAVREVNTGDIYISHIDSSSQWWTGVSLLNTTSSPITLTITFDTGQTKTLTLAANEHQAFTIAGLFEGQSQPGIHSAVITNANGVVGLELFGSGNQLSGILIKDDTATTIHYPHIASDAEWWTGIVAYNPSSSATTLTITPYSAGGTILSPQSLPIPGKGKYIGTVAGLSLPPDTAWFKIDAPNPITGFELFGTTNGNQLAGYTGVGISGKEGVFAKIEQNGWTGIAFVNIEDTAASVMLTAYDNYGDTVATQTVSLGSYAKEVRLAQDFFDQDIGAAAYIGYASDKELVGFQLNGSSDDMLLDGLPGLAGAVAGPPPVQNYGIILGTAKDLSGYGVGGVTVTADNSSADTNDQGWFSIADIAETDRLVVNFAKDGYVMTSEITRVRTGQSSYLEAVMAPEGSSGDIPADTGGTVTTSDNGSMIIGANTLVDGQGAPYTGTASVSLTTFDPTDDAQRNAFPGDFEGVTTTGETIPFLSYGFMDITVRDDSGAQLQLAGGATATISIPIPASLQGSAPDTMPLWYFNSADGKWHEEGTLTKNAGGDAYVGTITHFSIWNSDVGYNRSFVSGTVVNCVGEPVQGARVTIKGISPRNCWDSGETSTPADGTFGPIPVDADAVCQIWASKGGVSSDPIEFIALSQNQTLQWGNLVLCVNTPLITITLTWGENPSDLDSHLTIPMADGTREHVYFGRMNAGDARLDTDDVTSYGPEVTTVYDLHDGVYRYCVHHFSGSETISSSGASVNLVIDGVGIYNLTPPSGATASKDVWRLWDITVQNGAVTNVSTINDYLHGISYDDISAYSP